MTSSNRHLTLPLLVALALGAAFLLHAPTAEACMTFDCAACCSGCSSCFCDSSSGYCECEMQTQGDPARNWLDTARSVELIFTSPRTASIVIPTYSTTSLQPTTQCVTALSPIPGVESVDRVVNFDGRTGRPFEEVSFYSAPGPGEAIARLAAEQGVANEEGGAWHAFRSHITGTVRDGVPNSFVIDVTLEQGVTQAQFLKALQDAGVFLTSSSDANGIPTAHHSTFRRVGAAGIVVQLGEPRRNKPPKAPRQN